jgi:transcription initiation factor TFIIB
VLSKEVHSSQLLQRGLCPECGGEKFITDPETGEIACGRCGLVLQIENLSQKPEWRSFTPDDTRAKRRVGSPTTLRMYDKGLSTTFQPYKDTYGKPLPMKERIKMMRLHKWQVRSRMHSSSQQNLSKALSTLTRLADKLHIPKNVEESAALIYRKALNKGLVRGRSIKSLAAASLYAACRLYKTPRNLEEIVKTSTRSRKEISRNYRLIQRELDLTMPIDDPLQYVSKIASKVGLNQKTQNIALELLQKAKQRKALTGKGPAGVAAAALYIASILSEEKITQKKLAHAANVTEVTVRNRYKGLDESLGLKLRRTLRG